MESPDDNNSPTMHLLLRVASFNRKQKQKEPATDPAGKRTVGAQTYLMPANTKMAGESHNKEQKAFGCKILDTT